jgi:plastocyanin
MRAARGYWRCARPQGGGGRVGANHQNFDFEPKALTVAPGTEVTWFNGDEEPHNIVNADPGQPRLFRSQGLDGGEKYSFTFDKPGTYRYICSIHPRMEGTIIVKAPG